MGVLNVLKRQRNKIFAIANCEKTLKPEEKLKVRKKALNSDIYITSSNAITLNGQLVNIDGTGNRVGAMIFGPKKVIIVAEANKLVDTLDDAFARIKSIACPLNGKRLNLNTLCLDRDMY